MRISSPSAWVICTLPPRVYLRLGFDVIQWVVFRIAGSDTSSTTITYILWELSRRPDMLKKLQAELDEAMPDAKVIPDISALQELPYLNGVLREGEFSLAFWILFPVGADAVGIGLRVYGAGPSLLERVVPEASHKQGRPGLEEFDLMGYPIPAGTIVGTQAWSMHRNPSIFPNPEHFLPERWLELTQPGALPGVSVSHTQLTQMHQHFVPFGIGVRSCGGQNLAWVVLRVVLAGVCRSFGLEAPEETTVESMAIRDSFVSGLHTCGVEARLTVIMGRLSSLQRCGVS